jgi:hypothetical protein
MHPGIDPRLGENLLLEGWRGLHGDGVSRGTECPHTQHGGGREENGNSSRISKSAGPKCVFHGSW